MQNERDDNRIKLSFPVNAAYVSSARLTASSIANRMSFDIDEIEDIKTAVSEACTYIIKALVSDARGNFEISFLLREDKETMDILITAPGSLSEASEDDIGLMMIQGMVDSFNLSGTGKDNIVVKMTKKHKASIFS
ncbi:MAG: ATP-binding protein [Clostridiales bacterium]|jgi:serine/threonine-protein kinase RsbW|nr:ATP-binding protein [Clostridiales bacterium]